MLLLQGRHLRKSISRLFDRFSIFLAVNVIINLIIPNGQWEQIPYLNQCRIIDYSLLTPLALYLSITWHFFTWYIHFTLIASIPFGKVPSVIFVYCCNFFIHSISLFLALFCFSELIGLPSTKREKKG